MLDFASLYESHGKDVFRFALFLSGDRALAEDIASETFIRAWGARERIDLASVRAYLLAIARNLFLHGRRHAAIGASGERREVAWVEERASAEPSPETRAAARSELATVLTALQLLPEVDRAALLMRAEDEMPYEEIASALGISPAAARVKVHRARLRLVEARALAGRKTS